MDNFYCFYLYYLILFLIHPLNASFTPDTTNYDAYGVKIAMNQYFLVLAQNNNPSPTFFIQFAPYNDTQLTTSSSSQCTITYPNLTNTFTYTVALGKKQNQTQLYFFFAGELINDQSGPFIGMITFDNTSPSPSCNSTISYSIKYLSNYQHQEYYIIGVDPTGSYAYGFSNQFVFVFDAQNTSEFHIWDGNLTWPDSSFIPHAVDISDSFGVVAGFIYNGVNSTVKYSPMIYLININVSNYHCPITVDEFKPNATYNTWQDLLTNADAKFYSAKYDMSVSIDGDGNVLVGMQFINRVFLFSVNTTNPSMLNYVSRHTNGRSLGNGKSVAWLDNGMAAILINVYTLSYVWLSSRIFIFDINESIYNSTSDPVSIFPNTHQLLPSSMSSILLNVVSSPSSIALLDSKGKILIISSTQPGFYPSVQDTKSMPFITLSQTCLPGRYKNRSGIHDCILCPAGTSNPGNSSIACTPCSSESFCPLGAVDDVSQSALKTVFQVVPYPLPPESIIFDEILLHNMFSIGLGRCLLVSPLFWALIVAVIVIVIIVIMETLEICYKNPRTTKIRNTLKRTFRHTDLIGEGEFWVGGLASFSVIVLVSFAYAFSHAYLQQYPIETSSPSHLACDTKMRNAKFRTNVQSSAIPRTPDEKEMFDMLDHQIFTLNVDFVNTMVNCDSISMQALYGALWTTIRWTFCNATKSIVSLSIPLEYQLMSVRITLADIKTIGGLRIGLSSSGYEKKRYKLRDLFFYEPFLKDGYVLSQTLPVALALTKVINETQPMVDEESDFSGIFVPTFTVDMDNLFESINQYIRSSLQTTTLELQITETPYYVKNLQQPIARQSEIIFRNILFTIVCLEIFGLVFLSYKLAFKPIYYLTIRKRRHNSNETVFTDTEKQTNSDSIHRNSSFKSDGSDNDYISSTF